MNLKRFLFLFLLLAVPTIFFWVPGVIKVSTISCTSQFGPCSDVINSKIQTFKGRSLKEVKKDISTYLSGQSSVKDFSVRLKLPSDISINILESKPRFALADSQKHFFAAAGEEKEVLFIQENTSLPFVVIKDRLPNLGEKISDNSFFALKLQERLYRSYQVINGEVEDNSLKAVLPQGYTVYFPLEGDTDELLGALALIIYELNRAREDTRINTSVNTIDLRFENPVLR